MELLIKFNNSTEIFIIINIMTLTKATKEFLIQESFYGLFLLNLNKQIVSKDHKIKTAAVGLNGITLTLYVNENFWEKLTNIEQISILKHEVMHICFFHLTENFKADDQYIMNIAMDCAINQYILGLPKNCITLNSISQLIGKKLEPKKGSWYYYKEIKDFIQNNPNKYNCLNEFNEIDDHDIWPKDLSETERKLYENQIKSQLKETVETINKQAGNIPQELVEILDKIRNNPPIFNWKKYFRRVVGNTISNEIQLTKMRPSKRFPDSRGIKLKQKPNICVIIDTSGSISMDDFQEFFSEINHIYKIGIQITIIECDTKITNVFEYKKGINIEFKGRGGTDMTEAIKYYNNHKEFSSAVLFTDGYLSTFNLPLSNKLIWVITRNGNKSQSYPGQTIFIP